ncbi:MAG: hypothetical protein Q9172_006006 [Xanthocarpia lactea]
MSKTLVYLYLVQRVHTIREDCYGRRIAYRNDYICIISFILVITSVVAVYTFAFLHPIAIIGPNRQCTVGLPPSITISLLGLDLGLNIILTLMLYYLTSKALNKRLGLTFHLALHALPFRDPNPLIENLLGLPRAQFLAATKEGDKRLRVAKALWGTCAIMIPTAGNLGVLLYMKGHEQGWLCISCCIADGK